MALQELPCIAPAGCSCPFASETLRCCALHTGRKRSEKVTCCTERVRRRTQGICIVHQGPQGMVYQERAGCTLHWASHWTSHWTQAQMGPRTAVVLEGVLKAVHRVQHRWDTEHTKLKWSGTRPAGQRAHVSRPQPAILARNSKPAGVKLSQDCIGTRGPH